MSRKQTEKLTIKGIEKLLNQQTVVVLNAVDQKIVKLEKRLDKMEIRINQKIDRITTTLDKFLKRMTRLEDEKEVIKEKLGVTLD